MIKKNACHWREGEKIRMGRKEMERNERTGEKGKGKKGRGERRGESFISPFHPLK